MKKLFYASILSIFLSGNFLAQNYYKMGNALIDETIFNDAVTLSDGSFLLVMNHVRLDSSKTELLRLNNTGDTLSHRYMVTDEGLGIASAAVVGHQVILSFATSKGCRFFTKEHGFTHMVLNENLTEIKRSTFKDTALTEIPAGPLIYRDDKLYCFYNYGVYVFDKHFNFIASHKGFMHRLANDFDVINNKIVCTEYKTLGLELLGLDGTQLKYLGRKNLDDVVIYDNEIYLSADLKILRLSADLTVLDSVVTYARYGSIYYAYHLALYKNELVILGSGRYNFSRYSLPDLKVIPNSLGEFKYEESFQHRIDWFGRAVLANKDHVAKLGISWESSCINGHPSDYYFAEFQVSQAGVEEDLRYMLESAKVDTIWVEAVHRYPDYEPHEFDLTVGVQYTNDTDVPIREFEIGFRHNLDTACVNKRKYIEQVTGINMLPGMTDTMYFRNMHFNVSTDFDSLFIDFASMILTQNNEVPTRWKYCGWTWGFIHKNQIVERERPEPIQSFRYTVYPNPVSDMLTFDGILPAGAQVRVFNLSGKLIFEKYFDREETEWHMDVSLLPKALYFLEVRNSDFKELTKFVKQSSRSYRVPQSRVRGYTAHRMDRERIAASA